MRRFLIAVLAMVAANANELTNRCIDCVPLESAMKMRPKRRVVQWDLPAIWNRLPALPGIHLTGRNLE